MVEMKLWGYVWLKTDQLFDERAGGQDVVCVVKGGREQTQQGESR